MILMQPGSVFGCLSESEAVRGAGLFDVVLVGWFVDCAVCAGFGLRAEFVLWLLWVFV